MRPTGKYHPGSRRSSRWSVSILRLWAAQTPPGEPRRFRQDLSRVSDVYPGLASGCLTYARLADLPTGRS